MKISFQTSFQDSRKNLWELGENSPHIPNQIKNLQEQQSDQESLWLWNRFKMWSDLRQVKGTVRPDWICMRVVPLESPLKVH